MPETAVGILGTGSAVPDEVLTNAQLEQMVDTTDEWIVSRTGIKERRIAKPEQAASDLAYSAALRAIEHAQIDPAEIKLIICATVTPDMFFPSTACIVQAKLGLTDIPAFDLSAACSGFVYGLEVGSRMANSGYGHVLVIGVDVLSRITDFSDRSTCVLFGDGASAAVLGPVEPGFGILATEIGADGHGGSFLHVPDDGYIKMSGRDVFKFAVRIIERSAKQLLEKVDMSVPDLAWFVPHQANIRIIQAAANKLDIVQDKVFINLDRYGNTSSASVGLALDELAHSGELKHGDLVLLSGFGAGLTWGSVLMRWFGVNTQ